MTRCSVAFWFIGLHVGAEFVHSAGQLDVVADQPFVAALSQAPWPARLAFPVLRHLDDGGLVHQVKVGRERADIGPHMAAIIFMPNVPLLDVLKT